MDFHSVLSIAAQNSSINGKQVAKKFSTNLAPPKKEKKEKEKTVKSETLRKLIEEKERERRKKEQALQRQREEEERRRKEEEKKKIFRIPKTGKSKPESKNISESNKPSDSKIDKAKVTHRHSTDKVKVAHGNSTDKVKVAHSNSTDRVKVKHKNSAVKVKVKHETSTEKSSKERSERHLQEKSDKTKSKGEKTKSDSKVKQEKNKSNSQTKKEKIEEIIDPTQVKPTALSTHERSSHLYSQIEKVQNKVKESEVERKRREFEEKKAKLLLDIKAKGVTSRFDQSTMKKDRNSEKKPEETRTESGVSKTKTKKHSDHRDGKSEDPKSSNKLKTNLPQKNVMSNGMSNPKTLDNKILSKHSSHNSSSAEKPKTPNNGRKAPPPMVFSDLLKLAEQKAKEPVPTEIVKKPQPIPEPERPMTQEEKDRYIEEQRRKQRRLQDKQGNSVKNPSQGNTSIHKPSKNSDSRVEKSDNNKINGSKLKDALLNGIKKTDKIQQSNSKASASLSKTSSSSAISNHVKSNSGKVVSKSQSASSLPKSSSTDHKSKSSERHSMGPPEAKRLKLEKNLAVNKARDKHVSQQHNKHSPQTQMKSKTQIAQKRDLERVVRYDSENENILACGPSKPKPAVSQNPWDRITSQLKKNNPPPVKKRRIIEDEDEDSEYDEEMEGFITDEGSDLEEDYPDDLDYSRHIRQIFGYDKRKYRYESEREIAGMETNFREQMKEEARSARLGLQEDLEDIRREEEELKRKQVKRRR